MRNYKQFTEEEKKAYSERKIAEIKSAIEEIEEGVHKVFESDNWKNYLEFQSSFHKYSINNMIWIWLQNQHATQVASFQDWKKKGRYVKKGEKGIKVRIPTPKKIVEKTEDGKEEEYVKMFFKIGYVFDVSQTVGEEVPTICNPLEDNTRVTFKKVFELIPSLEKITGFKIKYLDDCGGDALGYCDVMKEEIVLLKNQSALDTLSTLIHECSHALNKEKNKKKKSYLEKCDEEIIAESVAYCTLHYFGLDTSKYSFEYIASWYNNKHENGKLNILKDILSEIHDNTIILIDDINNIL